MKTEIITIFEKEMFKSVFTIVLYFISLTVGCAQDVYIPMDSLAIFEKEMLVFDLNQRYEKSLISIKTKTRKEFKTLTKIQKSKYEFLKNKVTKGYILNDKNTLSYLDSIVTGLAEKNPSIPTENIKILLLRSASTNAMSAGDGVLMITAGLLNKLQNESQLAYIIGHELAHLVLDHSTEATQQAISLLNSEELKSKAKEIKRTKYKKSEKALSVLKNIIYSNSKYSKKHEIQSDSLGYVFLLNSPYDPSQIISALNILDSADVEKSELFEKTYKKWFAIPGQPFKDEWLKKYQNQFIYEKINIYSMDKDSIKSHPDAQERIIFMRNHFEELEKASSKATPTTDKAFDSIRQNFVYEEIESTYYLKEYGESLYKTLKLLQQEPNDSYLISMIGKNLEKMVEAQRSYTLNRYIDLPNPGEQTDSYLQFLSFIRNLRFSEMKAIANYYNKHIIQ